MNGKEHWITDETLKAMMAQRGFSEKAIGSLEPHIIDAIQSSIDHYGNQGADLGTAFDLTMRQLLKELEGTP